MNDFMLNTFNKLMDNGRSKSTAEKYICVLKTLNNNKNFKSFTFLRQKDNITEKFKNYSDSYVKLFCSAIISVLEFMKDKPIYKKLQSFYIDILNDKKNDIDNKPKNIKSQKQEDNWITWEEVEQIKNELREEAEKIDNKNLSKKQYLTILKYFVISLYTDLAPRRNLDYMDCFIIKKFNDKLETNKNYYSIDDETFYFYKYKTSKKYGLQKIFVGDNDDFMDALDLYLSYNPALKGKQRKNKLTPLLVDYEGKKLSTINSITRLLHKIFKKKIGSTMLRHIYLTDKYGKQLTEMKADAEEMGHSLELQKEYIVNEENNEN